MAAKPVSFSQTTITELMIPSYANFGGKIHGGILLSLMDKVAYATASKHAGTYCVTVTVDGVQFLEPVEVGELVSLKASVNYVGRTSLVVGIKVIAEDVKTNAVKYTNKSYFTMVAKDEAGIPTEVPELILESPTQVRRFLEAIKRRELKMDFNQRMEEQTHTFDLQQAMPLIADRRCQVQIKD